MTDAQANVIIIFFFEISNPSGFGLGWDLNSQPSDLENMHAGKNGLCFPDYSSA